MEIARKFKHASSGKILWSTVIGLTIFHALAVWALFEFSWNNLIASLVVWWIAASWGVGIGYHRMLTHGGFKAPKWLEYFFTFCGSLALQSGAISWVTTHRMHHKFVDTEQDPHSPRGGVFWSHMGWVLQGTGQNQTPETLQRYAPDLTKDKVHVFMNKYYWITPIIASVILYAIGGFSMVLWAIFLRNVLSWHFTWLVNSATHLWGSRRFETNDDSRNNGLVALVTFGEGWHNNHHAHPRSAKHGFAWYEFDFNWMQLYILQKFGLVTKLYAYKLKGHNEGIAAEPIQETA